MGKNLLPRTKSFTGARAGERPLPNSKEPCSWVWANQRKNGPREWSLLAPDSLSTGGERDPIVLGIRKPRGDEMGVRLTPRRVCWDSRATYIPSWPERLKKYVRWLSLCDTSRSRRKGRSSLLRRRISGIIPLRGTSPPWLSAAVRLIILGSWPFFGRPNLYLL